MYRKNIHFSFLQPTSPLCCLTTLLITATSSGHRPADNRHFVPAARQRRIVCQSVPLVRSETFPPTKDETPYSSIDSSANKYMKNTMINAPSYIPYYRKDDSFEMLQEDYNKLKGELILKTKSSKT